MPENDVNCYIKYQQSLGSHPVFFRQPVIQSKGQVFLWECAWHYLLELPESQAYFFLPPCIAVRKDEIHFTKDFRITICRMLFSLKWNFTEAVRNYGYCPRHRDAPAGRSHYVMQEMVTEGSRKDKTSMISLAVTNARWRILSTAVLPKVSRENQLA